MTRTYVLYISLKIYPVLYLLSLFYFSNDLLFCARDVSRLRMQRYCFFLYHQIIFNLFFKKFLKNLLFTSFSIYYKTNFFTPKLNFLSTYTPNRNFDSPSDSYFISKENDSAWIFIVNDCTLQTKIRKMKRQNDYNCAIIPHQLQLLSALSRK